MSEAAEKAGDGAHGEAALSTTVDWQVRDAVRAKDAHSHSAASPHTNTGRRSGGNDGVGTEASRGLGRSLAGAGAVKLVRATQIPSGLWHRVRPAEDGAENLARRHCSHLAPKPLLPTRHSVQPAAAGGPVSRPARSLRRSEDFARFPLPAGGGERYAGNPCPTFMSG